MNRIRILFLTLGLMVAGVSRATSTDPQILSARDAIYSGNFSGAEQILSAYNGTHPDDPYYHILHGILLDWKQITKGKYRAYDKKIFEHFDKARSLAEMAVEEDHNNIQKKVTFAHALMYLSKKMIDMGQNFRAGGYLKRAKDIMVYVQMNDPSNPEVDLPLGVFYYFSANVPKNLKWAASLLGFSGDRQKGIAYLQKAAAYDNFSQIDAQYLLAYTLHKYEKDFAQAQAYSDKLQKKYPANPEFQWSHAEIALNKKDYADALARLKKFDAFCETQKCAERYAFISHYHQFDAYKNLDDMQNAGLQIDLALKKDTGQENGRIVNLHYQAARLLPKDDANVCDHVKKIEKLQKHNVEVWEKTQTEFPQCLELAEAKQP